MECRRCHPRRLRHHHGCPGACRPRRLLLRRHPYRCKNNNSNNDGEFQTDRRRMKKRIRSDASAQQARRRIININNSTRYSRHGLCCSESRNKTKRNEGIRGIRPDPVAAAKRPSQRVYWKPKQGGGGGDLLVFLCGDSAQTRNSGTGSIRGCAADPKSGCALFVFVSRRGATCCIVLRSCPKKHYNRLLCW